MFFGRFGMRQNCGCGCQNMNNTPTDCGCANEVVEPTITKCVEKEFYHEVPQV